MIRIDRAILEINPDAEVIVAEKDGVRTFEWLNGTTPIPEAEIDAKLLELNEQEKANKVNGNQKLLDLGLTQAEATALTGYKPD
jgi:hypothetical protein